MSKGTKIVIAIIAIMLFAAIVRVALVMPSQNTEQAADEVQGIIYGLLIVLLIGVSYFLPALVGRNKRNAGAIFTLNLLLGWTLIGWVVAMVWAVAKDAPPTQVIVNPSPVQASPAAMLCATCGKYSAPNSTFCSHCGTALAAPMIVPRANIG